MQRQFVINEKDLESIEESIHVLREHIQSRGMQTEASLNETRSALAGLLCIIPKAACQTGPTWIQRPFRGPEPDGGGTAA